MSDTSAAGIFHHSERSVIMSKLNENNDSPVHDPALAGLDDEDVTISPSERFRRKIFKMVSVGVVDVFINQFYDVLSTSMLIVNLAITILNTYSSVREQYGYIFDAVELVTVIFFAVDYALRIYTAKCLYPTRSHPKAVIRYIFSFTGIIDFLSFFPYFMPMFFPAGAAVFKMFRVARILRLFRINAYYDSLNVITEVLLRKRQQLMSSIFIILVMMLASSLCMYSIENPVQPEVFSNAFSGIWWSVSTLLTVGYGDIYPITTAGKAMGIIIAFLGVGIVAIPTGIISAGFVEQYSKLQSIGNGEEEDVHFIKIELKNNDKWVGKRVTDLALPQGMIIAVIQRGEETMIPRGNVRLKPGDQLIIGADSIKGDKPVYLKEITIRGSHRWNGQMLRDLDISRQTFIIMIKRGDKTIIPKGDFVFHEHDNVILYSKVKDKVSDDEKTEKI